MDILKNVLSWLSMQMKITNVHGCSINQWINGTLGLSSTIAVCLLFGTLFVSCDAKVRPQNNREKGTTDTASADVLTCNVNRFLFFTKEATLSSVVDSLKKEKIPYRTLEREAQACEELNNDNSTGPFGELFTCPHSAFITIPTLKFVLDETKDQSLTFQNVLLIFHSDRLISMVLWEDSLRYSGAIFSLKDLYADKYGHGENGEIKGFGRHWIYNNTKDSVRVLFKQSDSKSIAKYETMTMHFPGFRLAYTCLSNNRAKELEKSKKEENEHRKKLFDKI